jgi:hypothetical protein
MSAKGKIDLSRSSQRWSEVANAGGFALRYADPLLVWLTATVESEKDAREILSYVLNHLAQKGFGEHPKGRLADHLLQVAIRVTNAFYRKFRPESSFHLQGGDINDPQWLEPWAANLLARAWRALERAEHAAPKLPLYTILQLSTEYPEATEEEFAEYLDKAVSLTVALADVPRVIAAARRKFAQLLADEVSETLMEPTDKDTLAELKRLELDELVAPYVSQDEVR